MDAQVQFRHQMLFYADDSVLLDGLTRFIASALNAGNPAIVWVNDSHQHNLGGRLRGLGVDIGDAIQRGLYVVRQSGDT